MYQVGLCFQAGFVTLSFPEKTTAYSALTPMIYLYPQDRAFTEQLYTLSMRLLEWHNPKLRKRLASPAASTSRCALGNCKTPV
jgi:hypothetical protein